MKTRHGFVSNSSSSSFVVGFNSVPQTQEELKQLLFGDKKAISMYGYGITTEKASKIIWDDLQGQQPLTFKQIVKEISCNWFEDLEPSHQMYKMPPEEREKEYANYRKRVKVRATEIAKKMVDESGDDTKFFRFHYEDHTNDGTVLEHGPTFETVPHYRISNH